jgi:hypothetical protein
MPKNHLNGPTHSLHEAIRGGDAPHPVSRQRTAAFPCSRSLADLACGQPRRYRIAAAQLLSKTPIADGDGAMVVPK